jgi:N-acetylmuramoyl-L-alanine amidase
LGAAKIDSGTMARWCSVPPGPIGRVAEAVSRTAETTDDSATIAIAERMRSKAFTLSYRENHIPRDTPNFRRPGSNLTPASLTIHSTGNPNSTAIDERRWLTNPTNDLVASFHIVVDEKEAIECIPLTEFAWHAGDGPKGTGNCKSIGLEICESGDRQKTLRNAIDLAAKILRDHNWGRAELRRHFDWNKKNCPRILIDKTYRDEPGQTWEWFTEEVSRLL